MSKYRVLKPLIIDDSKKVHQPGETVDITGDVEKYAVQEKAVEKLPEEKPKRSAKEGD